jgi:hypothetical protein
MACRTCSREMKIAAKGQCATCYQREHYARPPRYKAFNKGRICVVHGCEEDSRAKGFCNKHYAAQEHPLKKIWKVLRSRYGSLQYPESWKDFSAFLKDIGERPGPRYQLRRTDPNLPWAWDNASWLAPQKLKRVNGSKESFSAYVREWTLQTKYKISLDDYKSMLESQDGLCAICRGVEISQHRRTGKLKELAVDHCHATGKVRGLLCVRCNRGISYFKDTTNLLRSAISYLEKHQS